MRARSHLTQKNTSYAYSRRHRRPYIGSYISVTLSALHSIHPSQIRASDLPVWFRPYSACPAVKNIHVELSPTLYHYSCNDGRVCCYSLFMHIPFKFITETTYTYMVTNVHVSKMFGKTHWVSLQRGANCQVLPVVVLRFCDRNLLCQRADCLNG